MSQDFTVNDRIEFKESHILYKKKFDLKMVLWISPI